SVAGGERNFNDGIAGVRSAVYTHPGIVNVRRGEIAGCAQEVERQRDHGTGIEIGGGQIPMRDRLDSRRICEGSVEVESATSVRHRALDLGGCTPYAQGGE